MYVRGYREVRKTYIMARIEEPGVSNRQYGGNWRRGRKEDACREFDDFVQNEREVAVRQALEERGLL